MIWYLMVALLVASIGWSLMQDQAEIDRAGVLACVVIMGLLWPVMLVWVAVLAHLQAKVERDHRARGVRPS